MGRPPNQGSFEHRLELGARRVRSWRPTAARRWSLVRSMTTSYLALGVTLYVLPGRQSSGPVAVLGLVVAVAVVGVPLRPVLAGLAVVFGSFGLLVVGVVSQAVILDVAIATAPNVDIGGRAEVLVVSWLAAVVAAVLNWIFDAGSEDAFLAQLLGRAVRVAHRARGGGDDGTDGGLLVIQLDGVGEDVLRQAITAGDAPILSGWLRDGTHTLRGWDTGLPATTPAGQAVLLHGDITEIPSFRWFEKESGHMMVANHPHDAAEIERRISDGRGLLVDGGVSISNLFSGDAPTSLLTMSAARLPPRRTHGFASFATAQGGLVRSIVVSLGQVVEELYQGRRQRRRDVRPRVRRGVVFAVQRAVTTALLRDLTVALVAEQLARAAPVIFVDFVDYDEVAHHAGPSRPESMQTLEGFDRLAGFFSDVIRETGRAYEIAIVSDHGQSQGATFTQTSGRSIHRVVADLVAEEVPDGDSTEPSDVVADEAPAERWGAANLLLTGVARSNGLAARVATRAAAGGRPGPEAEITLHRPRPPNRATRHDNLVVATSGSLAHVYLVDVPGRVGREEIDRHHPGLIDGLARHPQIAAVMVRSEALCAPVAVGGGGWRILTDDGTIGGHGRDPIAVFGPGAASDLTALDRRRHVGDLVLLARYDPTTGEVAAFEELVGSHGGLGGGQTGALLMHPSQWPVRPGPGLHGIDVHELLRSRLATGKQGGAP